MIVLRRPQHKSEDLDISFGHRDDSVIPLEDDLIETFILFNSYENLDKFVNKHEKKDKLSDLIEFKVLYKMPIDTNIPGIYVILKYVVAQSIGLDENIATELNTPSTMCEGVVFVEPEGNFNTWLNFPLRDYYIDKYTKLINEYNN